MLYARSAMVIAAASAHVQAVDGVWVDLKRHGRARRLWTAIAPSRLLGHVIDSPVADRPHQSDVQPDIRGNRLRQRVIQAFEEANAGDGSIAFGGQLIDRPIVERARRTLELAKSLGTLLS